ncbi:MAG TPA: hypothetical protein VJ932_04660 [Alkalispirochaeta sp.]|nr:hypothetical protein [Alkalispirochaeta sp.]
MVFTGVLAYAAWQDGRQCVIGTLPVAAMLAVSLAGFPTPARAIAPLIIGAPWFWLLQSGAAGSAEPPAAVAIVFRHGITMGLMALGIACIVTAAALITPPPGLREHSYPYERAGAEPRRVPFYPGLLIAHILITRLGTV